MRPMIVFTVFVVSVVLASSCAQRPQSTEAVATESATTGSQTVEQILTQAEREKAVAMTSGPQQHTAWFDRWIAEDMIFTGADGQVSSDIKNSVRENLASGAWKVESVSIDNIKVHLFGESAVVTATQTEKSQLKGRDSGGRFQYTHVWLKRNGRWQVGAGHATRLE